MGTTGKTKTPVILLVEDDLGLAEIIAEELLDQGMVCERVNTGSQALAWTAQHTPSLIILDYALPDMTGTELLAALRRGMGAFPFLVITGHGSEHIAVEMMKAGARDYLIKDATLLDRLPTIVRRTLEEIETGQRLRQTEAALRESEWRMGTIIDFLPDATMVIDAEGRVIAWNRAMEKLSGIPAAEMLGQGDYAYALPFYGIRRPMLVDLVVRPQPEWEGSFSQFHWDSDTLAAESFIPHLRGRDVHLWCAARLLRDAGGKVFGAIETLRDITARKEAEEEILHLNRFYKQILNGIVNGVWVTNALDIVTYVNRGMMGIVGFSEHQFLGMRIVDDLPSQTQASFGPLYAEARTSLKPVAYASIPLDTAGGRKTYQSGWLIPVVKDGRYNGMICTTEDITAHKQAEKERALLQEQLQQAQKMESIGRLAGGVAHDFNNLLAPIIGYCDLILKDGDAQNPHYDKIKTVLKAAVSAKELTRQLLTFSRKQLLTIKSLDLNEVITGFHWVLRRTISENIVIATQLACDLGAIKADMGQIEQIVMNLAVNAQDAMPGGGTITISTDNIMADETSPEAGVRLAPGAYIRLRFEDSGAGMEAETLAHIFEPFFTTKDIGKGTGLGLSNVYGIVKQHGGEILVESAPGKGTRFDLYFPRVAADPSHDEVPTERIPSIPATETILVVEDDDNVRDLVAQMLTNQGYSILVAEDPARALEISAGFGGEIDMLLSDVVMPQMNGVQLYALLSEERPRLRVVYMSGYSPDILSTYGARAEGLHFLQKPFTADHVSRALRQVMTQSDR